ncbi:hypothetical protein U91I_03653 [alpha proteobacterium U9-1i]|nr:hypothetical protein U91I_03653 [alpha proteobacterium U9-1i]
MPSVVLCAVFALARLAQLDAGAGDSHMSRLAPHCGAKS